MEMTISIRFKESVCFVLPASEGFSSAPNLFKQIKLAARLETEIF